MSPESPESRSSSRRFAYLLAYTVVLGVGAILVAWLMTKMARTDKADRCLISVGAVIGVSALALAVGFALRGRSRR